MRQRSPAEKWGSEKSGQQPYLWIPQFPRLPAVLSSKRAWIFRREGVFIKGHDTQLVHNGLYAREKFPIIVSRHLFVQGPFRQTVKAVEFESAIEHPRTDEHGKQRPDVV